MPRFFTDDKGVDWVHAEDAKKMVENKYEDKHYKIIKVPFDVNRAFDDDQAASSALEQLEFEVDDYMKNADDDYCPVGVPTIYGNVIAQVLVDEDFA